MLGGTICTAFNWQCSAVVRGILLFLHHFPSHGPPSAISYTSEHIINWLLQSGKENILIIKELYRKDYDKAINT